MSFDRNTSALKCLMFCAALSTLLSVFAVVMQEFGLPYEAYFRDSIVFDVPFAGAISNIGIALMTATAALAALTWRMSRESPFLFLTAFATLFALDDGMMVHEAMGDADKLLVAGYGLLFGATYLSFRQTLIWPLLFVVACFVFSVALDEAQWIIQIRWVPYYLLEDGAKFCGIGLLFLFALSEWVSIRRGKDSGATASV